MCRMTTGHILQYFETFKFIFNGLFSFKAAFDARHVRTVQRNGKTIHQFQNKLQRVPSKIFTGKLGDSSIRLGRYKLIRWVTLFLFDNFLTLLIIIS